MAKRILMIAAAAAMSAGLISAGIASTVQAQVRAAVTLHNKSGSTLVFQLSTAESQRWTTYRIGPGQRRRFVSSQSLYTRYFQIRISTQGRGAKQYALRPNRTYSIAWDRNRRIWNVFAGRGEAYVRPFVRIYNSSNRRLVFFLKSDNSGYGRKLIGPGQTIRYNCRCRFTRYFTVRIGTRFPNGAVRQKVYTLVQGRSYRFYLNRNTRLWDVRGM